MWVCHIHDQHMQCLRLAAVVRQQRQDSEVFDDDLVDQVLDQAAMRLPLIRNAGGTAGLLGGRPRAVVQEGIRGQRGGMYRSTRLQEGQATASVFRIPLTLFLCASP